MINFTQEVTEDKQNSRLDIYLKDCFPEFSRTQIQNWIENGAVTLNDGAILSPKYKVKIAEIYTLNIPEPVPAEPLPVEMDLDIVYEDDDIVVVNKEAGLVVHPAVGHYQDTLVNGLLHACQGRLSGIGGVLRPGIVHRLDKDTSGLMVVAKNDFAHQKLSDQFANKSEGLYREYLAFTWGHWSQKSGTICTHIGRHPHDRQRQSIVKETAGKNAITHFEVIDFHMCSNKKISDGISLVSFVLETGRTHQIRVHAQHLGHALLGDPLYGRDRLAPLKKYWPENVLGFKRQALHAKMLTFIHPRSGERMVFEADFPEDLMELQREIAEQA
jgi:23S rRNA pseudouridine1911/1915/1917 synthase